MLTDENFNGFLAFVFFMAVPLAALLGAIIRRRYRKAIARAMRAGTPSPGAAFAVPGPSHPNGAALQVDVAPLSRAPPLRPALALRYLAAGLAFALVLVTVMFLLDGIGFAPLRFAVVVAAFLLPALIMALYVAGLRWYWMVAAGVFWTWLLYVIAPESNDVLGILVGPALMLALLVGNPALRTTAVPLFMVAVALVVPLVFALEAIYLMMLAGVLDFLLFLLPPGLVAAIYVILGLALMLAVGTGLALLVVRAVARLTARSSELMMQHDLLWLFQCVWVIGLGWGSHGPLTLAYLLAFAAYRGTLALLRPRAPAQETHLLLRVFGQQGTQTRLARSLLLDWRQRGPVLMIGAEDLATETLDAPELAAFLRRRLSDLFIDSPVDLAAASAAGTARQGDGLFPMQDYYCRDSTWQPTVLTLMAQARRILVDMRGFDPANQGILFEIDALAARVPTDRLLVVCAPDAVEQVTALFAGAWARAGREGQTDRLTLRTA